MIEGLDKRLTADVDTGVYGTRVLSTGLVFLPRTWTLTIHKHSYICEYRATITTQTEYDKLTEEYTANDEGSYEQVSSKWAIFDATRKLDQYGCYINHAPAWSER